MKPKLKITPEENQSVAKILRENLSQKHHVVKIRYYETHCACSRYKSFQSISSLNDHNNIDISFIRMHFLTSCYRIQKKRSILLLYSICYYKRFQVFPSEFGSFSSFFFFLVCLCVV